MPQDAEQVTCMSIHPSGDFLAVTTEGPVLRFYDINTCQCYVCPYPREHHSGPLTSVRYAADARVCATASKDGDVKVRLGSYDNNNVRVYVCMYRYVRVCVCRVLSIPNMAVQLKLSLFLSFRFGMECQGDVSRLSPSVMMGLRCVRFSSPATER